MIHGVAELIDAGVPASVFPTHAEYYRVGEKGKLHLKEKCIRNSVALPVEIALPDLRKKNLCQSCAQYAAPPKLSMAIKAAKVIKQSMRVIARVGSDWNAVSDLNVEVAALESLLELPNPEVVELAKQLRDQAASRSAQLRAELPIDRTSWMSAAAVFASDIDKDSANRTDLNKRRAALFLPPYRPPLGPRDGAWILLRLKEALVESLSAGGSWEHARAAVLGRARDDIVARDAAFTEKEEALFGEYFAEWKDMTALDVALNHGEDRVIIFRGRLDLPFSDGAAFRRLLAPTTLVVNLPWVVAVVPGVVANALVKYAKNASAIPELVDAGPAHPSDTPAVLALTADLLMREPDMVRHEALVVARGIATIPDSAATAHTQATSPATAPDAQQASSYLAYV